MSIAIAALLSAVAVIFVLSGVTTTTPPIDTLFNTLVNQRPLAVNDAATALFYSVVVYAMAFSASLFVLRFLGLFLAAMGVPNEDQIRRNRELNRQNRIMMELQQRQARLIVRYMLRAQAADARRREEAAIRRSVGGEPPATR